MYSPAMPHWDNPIYHDKLTILNQFLASPDRQMITRLKLAIPMATGIMLARGNTGEVSRP